MLARQRLFPVTDFVWCSLSFYVTFWQTQGGALCDHHRNIILCFDATPCLLWEYIAPITLACKVFFFLKHLSLGKFFPSASQLSYVSCVAHSWNCLLAFAKKQITLGPCQKSRESQQCCDNPRVKGVNMRREFHAWQVRRMAPVFSLFIHANEQYADEQTWAGPCLLHKNWQKACWCGSLTTSRISCVCVVLSDDFLCERLFPGKWGFCHVLSDYSWWVLAAVTVSLPDCVCSQVSVKLHFW